MTGEDVSAEVVEDVVIGSGAGRTPRLEAFEEAAVVEGLEALLRLAELSEVQSSQLVGGHDQMPVEVVADVEISVGHPARGSKSVGPSDALASQAFGPATVLTAHTTPRLPPLPGVLEPFQAGATTVPEKTPYPTDPRGPRSGSWLGERHPQGVLASRMELVITGNDFDRGAQARFWGDLGRTGERGRGERELERPFTLKVYESDKEVSGDGAWRHTEIRLKPDTTATGYKPIVLRDVPEDEIQVIAEFVEVLPGA